MTRNKIENGRKIFAAALALCAACLISANAGTVKENDAAPNFNLKTLDDKTVELSSLTAKSRVALVVLRGWPGYQCPLCERQVHDLARHAPELKAAGAQMLFVYPGPANTLNAHASEFLQNKSWPAEFILVTDPDYSFVNRYGLRWDAKNETAYPSTFIIGRDGKVKFAHISKGHGDRVDGKELLKHLDMTKEMPDRK